jgi:hypothetical protein
MQRRRRENDADDDAQKLNSDNSEQSHPQPRRKIRRVSRSAESVGSHEDRTVHSTASASISVLLEPTSSPASVLQAILDIKSMISIYPSSRSVVVNCGCIQPLVQHLGVGFDNNDDHILQVVSALCKDNSDVRERFRTDVFIKKAVALAIPALGDRASSSPIAQSARLILKTLSDNSSSDFDKNVLNEQQQRIEELKVLHFMSQTLPYNTSEPGHNENSDTCSVCLESLDHVSSDQSTPVFNIACHLPCNHSYHKSCISKWFSKHASCPVCRHKLQEPPRTPPILPPSLELPFPMSMFLGLGAFGSSGGISFGPGGVSFGIPNSIMPSGMNVVFVFRSSNSRLRNISIGDLFDWDV